MSYYGSMSPYTGGGWPCQQCGAFVPAGTTHFCQSNVRWVNPPPPPPPTALDRIADSLERLIDLIDEDLKENPSQ